MFLVDETHLCGRLECCSASRLTFSFGYCLVSLDNCVTSSALELEPLVPAAGDFNTINWINDDWKDVRLYIEFNNLISSQRSLLYFDNLLTVQRAWVWKQLSVTACYKLLQIYAMNVCVLKVFSWMWSNVLISQPLVTSFDLLSTQKHSSTSIAWWNLFAMLWRGQPPYPRTLFLCTSLTVLCKMCAHYLYI